MDINLDLELTKLFIDKNPKHVADIVSLHSPEEMSDFIKILPRESYIKLFNYIAPNYISRMFSYWTPEETTDILSDLDISIIVNILFSIDKKRQSKILKELPSKKKITCKLMLTYSYEQVGSHVITNTLMLFNDINVEKALAIIEKSDGEVLTDPIYVLNDKRNICGKISIFKLMQSDKSTSIYSLMSIAPKPISSRSPIELVKEHEGWKTESLLPVVNQSQEAIGIIKYTTLLAALDKISYEYKILREARPVSAVMSVYVSLLSLLFSKISTLNIVSDTLKRPIK